MKANELMIGDWVQDTNCISPSRVAGVTPKKVHTWWADGTKHSKDEVYFEPILLTPAKLENNGFQNRGDWYFYKDESCVIEIKRGDIAIWIGEQGDTYSDILLPMPDSVHELQHALRLCGLNDLADNFKI